MRMSDRSDTEKRRGQLGTAQIEQLVLIVTVAVGFASAAVPLGSLLFQYHRSIEIVLALPIP
jgi:hypothetical protein